MQYIVQPVLEKGANHPTFTVNATRAFVIGNVGSSIDDVGSKRVLQANGTTLGHAGYDENASGQTWWIQDAGNGRYKIRPATLESCLDGSNQAEVTVSPSSGAAAQTWELVPLGSALYRIRSSTPGKVLSESDGKFVLADEYIPADDSPEESQKHQEQHFVLTERQTNALAETYGKTISVHSGTDYGGERRDIALGKYDNGVPGERVWRMRNLGSRNCLGLNNEGGDRQNAAQAIGWLAASWRQLFRIEPVPGTSYYRFFEVETGLVLATNLANPAAGDDVKGFPPGDNPAGDRWEILPRQGCFLIVAAGTELAMEHYHVANEEWVELRKVAPDGGDLQRWVLEDETTWEVDTKKEYMIYNPTAAKWLYDSRGMDPLLGAWAESLDRLWRLTKVSRTADGRQIYTVEPRSSQGRRLSMPSVANDHPLTLGQANDRWHVVGIDDGVFRVRAEGVGGSVRFDMSTRGPSDAAGLVTAFEEVGNEHKGNQEWALIEKRDCTIDTSKRYVITTSSGLALHMGDSVDSHAPVSQETADQSPHQTWKLEPVPNIPGYYYVIHQQSGFVLSAGASTSAVDARTQLSSGFDACWKLDFVSPNKYTLTHYQYKTMSLDGKDLEAGSGVYLAASSGAASQGWHLNEIRDGRVISDTNMTVLDFSPVAIKSLRVPAGVRVTLFDGPHLTGASKVLLEDTSNIGAFHVASLLVEPIVTLRGSGGVAGHLGMGEYTAAAIADLGIYAVSITAIDVPQGMQVEVFDADDFYGEQRVLTFGAPSLADAGVTTVKSIRVKALGVLIPPETLRYGDIITLHSQRSDTKQLAVPNTTDWMVAWGEGGPATQFKIERAGPTRFKDLVCYGDVVALKSLYRDQLYVKIMRDAATMNNGSSAADEHARFVLVRAAAGASRTFVSRGDVLAFFQETDKLYLSADWFPNGQYLRAAAHLYAWEGWKIQYVWPRDAASTDTRSAPVDGSSTTRTAPQQEGVALVEDGSEQRRTGKGRGAGAAEQGPGAAARDRRAPDRRPAREGRRVAAVEQVLSSGSLARSLPGRFSPLRFTGARSGTEAFETRIYCGADACEAATCFADGGMLSVCGAAATGVGFCAVDIAAVGVCGAALALQAICGVDAAGFAFCAAAASGIAVCGADVCGAAACGVAACTAAGCGAAACGANAGAGGCGVDVCSVDGSIISACPADVCAANACVINLCPADACAADACIIDLIPIIPGI